MCVWGGGGGGGNVYIDNPGQMAKMPAMLYGKNPSKSIFFCGTDFNQTWHVVSETKALQRVHKL